MTFYAYGTVEIVRININNKNGQKEHPSIRPSSILLPLLHIKLQLKKQLVKALDKERNCFKHLEQQFSGISDAKLMGGIFDEP